MSQNLLSGPGGSSRDDAASTNAAGSNTTPDFGNSRYQRHAGAAAASADQCLRALTQLPGLVAMGMLTPAQANSMRATYATILQHYQKTQSTPSHAPATADVVQAVRNNPELAALLEPLLTDEQIEALMQETREDGDSSDG